MKRRHYKKRLKRLREYYLPRTKGENYSLNSRIGKGATVCASIWDARMMVGYCDCELERLNRGR